MRFREASIIRWVLSLDKTDKIDLANSATFPPEWDEVAVDLNHLKYNKGAGYGLPELKEAIAKRNGVDVNRIIIGVGTSGVNALIFMSLLEPEDQVIIEQPYYEPLVRLAQLMNAEVRFWERKPEDQYRLNPESLDDLLTPKTRLVVISNLHNPSQAFTGPDKLTRIGAKVASEGAYLLCDEVYSEFVPRYISASSFHQSIITTSSLSKILDMGGLRIGWGIAPLPIVERCERLGEIFYGELSLLCQKITLQAYQKLDDLKKSRIEAASIGLATVDNWIIKNRAQFSWVRPEHGGVAFIKINESINDMALMEYLKKNHNVLITPGTYFGATGYFRISVTRPKEMIEKGLEFIALAVKQLKDFTS